MYATHEPFILQFSTVHNTSRGSSIIQKDFLSRMRSCHPTLMVAARVQ